MSSVAVKQSQPGEVVGFRYGPELALLAVVLMWSTSHILSKATYAQINPLAMTFARFTLITLLAFTVLWIRGRPVPVASAGPICPASSSPASPDTPSTNSATPSALT